VTQKHHRLETLPDGWFYNGRNYVSMDGQRSDRHPGTVLSLNVSIQINYSWICVSSYCRHISKAEGGAERLCGIFLRHKICKNYVCSVKAWNDKSCA